MKYLQWILCFGCLIVMSACGRTDAVLGSQENPIKMYFVPSSEVNEIIQNAQTIQDYLHVKTGYYFETAVPLSYAAVIEAMGSQQADIAWLATFAYILAHEKYGAEVALSTVRYGQSKYRGQFVARVDSKIDSLADIKGKTIAYTDPMSTSGYMYPAAQLAHLGIEPDNSVFVGGHPQAIIAVYAGRTDVGCTYWSPEYKGVPQDARNKVMDTYDDIFEKVKIVGFTDWIPNDTVTFRKNFPPEMQAKIVNTLLDYVATDAGKETMRELYSIDGLIKASDADYDVVRQTLETLGQDLDSIIQ